MSGRYEGLSGSSQRWADLTHWMVVPYTEWSAHIWSKPASVIGFGVRVGRFHSIDRVKRQVVWSPQGARRSVVGRRFHSVKRKPRIWRGYPCF